MKRKTIERVVPFASKVLHVLNIHSDDELYYFDENLGKRCKGSIMVYGQVETDSGKQMLQDELFLDVFAPKEKLNDESFSIKVEKIDYEVEEEKVLLQVFLQIEGISDQEEKPKKEEHRFDPLEQMFDKENMVNLCTLHVVQEDDTYASIAYQYQVEESMLREYNLNKELQHKMLVMIPN